MRVFFFSLPLKLVLFCLFFFFVLLFPQHRLRIPDTSDPLIPTVTAEQGLHCLPREADLGLICHQAFICVGRQAPRTS